MKISDYIACLERVKAEIGDVEVHKDSGLGRHVAGAPEVAYTTLLRGREHKQRFWSIYEADSRRGEVVCRV